jgi:hypothetical protein
MDRRSESVVSPVARYYVLRLRAERDRVGASFALRALAGLGWRFAR